MLGLLVLFAQDSLSDRLPATPRLASLMLPLLVSVVPAFLSWIHARKSRTWLRDPGLNLPGLRRLSLFRLVSVPLAYWLYFEPGDLAQLAKVWSGGFYLAEFSVLIAPLLLLEFSVMLAERAGWSTDGLALGGALGNPFRRPVTLLILVLFLAPAALMDVAFRWRGAEVFFSWTTLGGLAGFLVLVLMLCVLMPQLVRWLLPLSRKVPEYLVRTAESLGFARSSVLTLHTDQRLVNAAMVGPFGWPRYLILTDAIQTVLEPMALRGVVAHEVAHARARHPLILLIWLVLMPVLVFQAMSALLGPEDVLTLIGTVTMILILLIVLRPIAHRFEFEADQLSAEALGGAAPCVEALKGVGDIAGTSRRGGWRHPSESARIIHLATCEADPEFRRRFHARGRKFRWWTWGLLLATVVLCTYGMWMRWPADRAVMLLYTGRFPQATTAMQHMPPPRDDFERNSQASMRHQLAIAVGYFPEGGHWHELEEELGQRAWRDGLPILRSGDAARAKPYLALGLLRKTTTPLEHCLYLYCAARAAGNADEAERVRQHVLQRLEPSASVRELLQG